MIYTYKDCGEKEMRIGYEGVYVYLFLQGINVLIDLLIM